MRRIAYFATAILLTIVDQMTKILACVHLRDAGRVIELIPGIFELKYCENRGVAFSLLEGQRWLFIPTTLIVVLVMVFLLLRSPLRRSWVFSLSCTMILSGGVGNLIDRIVYGYVVDFLYFKWIQFPIFNFADCCVVVGTFLLFGYFLFGLKGEENTPLRTLLFGIPAKGEERQNG